MSDKFTKILVVALILLFAVIFDQVTKFWAEDNLASPRFPEHVVVLTVDGESATTVSELIDKRYPQNSDLEKRRMMAGATVNGKPLSATESLEPGSKVLLNYAMITVIDGYYDYQYARNPGAAWSFLADQSAQFRYVFFGITGVLAVILLFVFIVRTPWRGHKFFIVTLACILGGAIGNIIDRFRFGYVIDFISWHIGDKYWPTFNIADVFVTCGVVLLIIGQLFCRNGKEVKVGESDGGESVTESQKNQDAAKG